MNNANDNEKAKYKIFVIILLFFLLTFGVFVGLSVSYNSNVSNDLTSYTPKDMENDLKQLSENVDGNDNTEAVSTKTHDIEVIYIDHYLLCNETIQKSEIVYDTTLEKLKEDEKKKQQNNKKEYEIKEETNERLIFERKVNENCPNHFFVKLEDNQLNIYNIITNEKHKPYKSIDISEELIRPELMEQLKQGITANSIEELNFIIEDVES